MDRFCADQVLVFSYNQLMQTSLSRLIKMVVGDGLRGMVVLLSALLVVCPMSILFILIPLWEDPRNGLGDWVIIAAGAAWLLLFIGGIITIIAVTNARRKRWLDGVFTPLGLKGRRYLLNWWEYTGSIHGRRVSARFYKGPTLDICVESSLATRATFSPIDQESRFLADLAGTKPVPIHPDVPVQVYAHDETWAGQIIQNEAAKTAILHLLTAGESWALYRRIMLQPGAVRLYLYRNKNMFEYNFTADEARVWLDNLIHLAGIAESLPAPLEELAESNVERAVRTGTVGRNMLIFTAVFGALCLLGSAFLVLLIVFLSN